jgi:hypothetical protein
MKRKRWWLIPLIIVLALGSAGLWFDYSARARLAHELDENRKVGLPVTPAEMAGPPVPVEENAAGHYQLAFERSAALDKDDRTFGTNYTFQNNSYLMKYRPDWLKKVPVGKEGDRAVEVSKAWAKVFEAVDLATSKPKLSYVRHWERGSMVLFPEYARMKELAKALCLDAELAARDQDTDRMMKRLREARQIGLHCYQEPTLIGLLVGIACESIADARAMNLAYQYREDASVVSRIREFFQEEVPMPDMRTAMKGESFLMAGMSNELARSPTDLFGGGGGDDYSGVPDRAVMNLLKIGWVRNTITARVIANERRAYLELPHDSKNWKQVEPAMSRLDQAQSDNSPMGQLASMLTPVFSQAGQSIGKVDVRRRHGVVVTRIMDIVRTTGSFPGMLPDMGPVGIDPYSGKPFIYRKTADGFVLYSVGPDGKDDGGTFPTSSGKGANTPLSPDIRVYFSEGSLHFR